MWSAIIKSLEDPEVVLHHAHVMEFQDLAVWINLHVPSLRFHERLEETVKAGGLDVELDRVYHVRVYRFGENPDLQTQAINTAPPPPDWVESVEPVEPVEETEETEETINLAQTAAEVIKQIEQVEDLDLLDSLRAEEIANKRRSTVLSAIEDRLEDLQTQP